MDEMLTSDHPDTPNIYHQNARRAGTKPTGAGYALRIGVDLIYGDIHR